MYLIIHKGGREYYERTLFQDIKHVWLIGKNYTKEGLLAMIEKELEGSNAGVQKGVDEELTAWIAMLRTLLDNKQIAQYEEQIENIESSMKAHILNKAEEFLIVNDAVQQEVGAVRYAGALSTANVYPFVVRSKLAEIDKYNKFLQSVIKGKQSIISQSSSSLVASQESPQDFALPKTPETTGGIDMTDKALHINFERWGSLADIEMELPKLSNVEAIDLDGEYAQIQAMASSGIRPSDMRILEFIAACYYREEFNQRLSEITACLKEAHALDEREGRASSPDPAVSHHAP